MAVSKEGGLGPSKGHHWKGYRDWNINSDLTSFDFIGKFSCSSTVICKNSRSVSVHIAIDQFDSLNFNEN